MGNLLKELEQLRALSEKFGLMSISEYSSRQGISRMTVYRKIRADLLNYITIGGVKFIITRNVVRTD